MGGNHATADMIGRLDNRINLRDGIQGIVDNNLRCTPVVCLKLALFTQTIGGNDVNAEAVFIGDKTNWLGQMHIQRAMGELN